jgi:hypothetical protein
MLWQRQTCFVQRLERQDLLTQQQTDYKINIELDDKKSRLTGSKP